MPYGKFDPKGERPPERSLLPTNHANPVVVIFQLTLIFMVVRIVMLLSGIAFIYIPVIDDLLVSIIRLFK